MDNLLNFLHMIGKLKTIKRKGWVMRNVPDSETVAEHTFRAAVMAMVLAKNEGVDKNKCIRMLLAHDLAESIIGDITPRDNLSDAEKHAKEKKAMEELASLLGDNEMLRLWLEYEERKTPEAKFAYDIDKIEMLVQAYEYEKEHKGKVNLDEFWPSVEKAIHGKTAKAIFRILAKKR